MFPILLINSKGARIPPVKNNRGVKIRIAIITGFVNKEGAMPKRDVISPTMQNITKIFKNLYRASFFFFFLIAAKIPKDIPIIIWINPTEIAKTNTGKIADLLSTHKGLIPKRIIGSSPKNSP